MCCLGPIIAISIHGAPARHRATRNPKRMTMILATLQAARATHCSDGAGFASRLHCTADLETSVSFCLPRKHPDKTKVTRVDGASTRQFTSRGNSPASTLRDAARCFQRKFFGSLQVSCRVTYSVSRVTIQSSENRRQNAYISVLTFHQRQRLRGVRLFKPSSARCGVGSYKDGLRGQR
ncbi:hypothetical protein C8R47DRAFT_421911 [Mycena vitilis]|nr:hypothetical protein C8R47DRAFT_421911 [Mycena vitilis]